MKSLFKKEMRSLVPMLALMAVFFGGDLIFMPWSAAPDDLAWTHEMPQLEAGGEVGIYGFFVLVFAFVMAYSLFPREHDERTIEMLYALPVGRGQIFLAKFLAAWVTFGLGALSEQITAFVLQAGNPQSFVGEQWRAGIAFTHFGLVLATGGIVLCHAVLLSFLRRFGLLVYTALATAQYQAEKFWSWAALLDPTELLQPRYDGVRWLVPWTALMVQSVVAGAALVAAYLVWMGPARRAMAAYQRATGALGVRLLLGCASAALGVFFFVLFGFWAMDQEEPPSDGVQYRTFRTLRQETEHFVFTYPANLGEPSQAVIDAADAAHAAIATRLAAPTSGEGAVPTVVAEIDYRDSSILGLEAGGVIRMVVGEGPFDDRRVLLHETTHAFQSHLGDRGLVRAMESTRFFSEGSAEHVAWEVLAGEPEQPERRAASRRLAMVAHEVHRIEFEDLVAHGDFVRRFAPELYYPLGESWTEALVRVCGEGAVGETLRAIGRPDAPQDLAGTVFWQDTLAAVGCDLEQVLEAWDQLLADLAAEQGELLEALPRWGGALVRGCPTDEKDGTEADPEALCFRAESLVAPLGVSTSESTADPEAADPEATELVLRVRADPSVGPDGVRTSWGEARFDGERWVAWFRIRRGWATGPTVEAQIGWRFPGADWLFTESWRRVDVP